jgi:hypothetical protein
MCKIIFLNKSLDSYTLVPTKKLKDMADSKSTGKKFDMTGFALQVGSIALGLTLFTLVNRHFLSKM